MHYKFLRLNKEMENIIQPTMDYDLSKLYFGPPSSLAGGAYFARLMYNTNKAVFVQTPKSLTKQGFIKSGKKIYTDLMFDNNDTVFINWIENLETKCQELLYSKRDSWFETKLEKDDIESAFTSPFKIFKSGKYYLLRVNVKPNIKIFDETNKVVSIDDITNETNLISIIEIQGIKFSSRNFQMEIELKQSMIVSPDPFLDECFIKNPIKNPIKKHQESIESNNTVESNNALETIDLDDLIKQTVAEFDIKREASSKPNISSKTSEPVKLSKSDPVNGENMVVNLEDITTMNTNLNAETKFSNSIHLKPVEPIEDENIVIDIVDLNVGEDLCDMEDPTTLKEFDLNSEMNVNNLETITLKKPNQVYYEIYQKAREKAKEAKKQAILAYIEMKNIKKTYMLDEIDESDNEFDEFDDESLEDNLLN